MAPPIKKGKEPPVKKAKDEEGEAYETASDYFEKVRARKSTRPTAPSAAKKRSEEDELLTRNADEGEQDETIKTPAPPKKREVRKG
jgi:hypothetical protein